MLDSKFWAKYFKVYDVLKENVILSQDYFLIYKFRKI